MKLIPAHTHNKVRIFSFGGGVQSTAVLVLNAQGKLRYDYFIFANVGDDSENPGTLQYIEEVAKPYAKKHGIEIVTVQKTYFGKPDTVLQSIKRTKNGVPIPAFIKDKDGYAVHMQRRCTVDFKALVVQKWLKEQRYSHAVVGIGFSLDEVGRMRYHLTKWHDSFRGGKIPFMRRVEYPLLDLELNRSACIRLTYEAGLPRPPKSACWFCPYTGADAWQELKNRQRPLFEKAVMVDSLIRHKNSGYAMYLHRSLQPLEQAVGEQLDLFPESEPCGSGYCFL